MPLVIHSFLRSKDLYNHWEKRDSNGGWGGGVDGGRWEDEEERLRRQRVNERTHAPTSLPSGPGLIPLLVAERNHFKYDPPC